jgi:hypothetical protein
LYVTQSGGRGSKVPVPLYRVERGRGAGAAGGRHRESDVAGVRAGWRALYLQPLRRPRLPDDPDDRAEIYATDLGVATGLAFSPDGTLFVGDRAGTIFKVTADRQVESFATLPASVAAFHLAFGPDGNLYVAAPTLASRDPLYRITPDRLVDVVLRADSAGRKVWRSTVRDALCRGCAGGVVRALQDWTSPRPTPSRSLVVAAPALIGIAFNPSGGLGPGLERDDLDAGFVKRLRGGFRFRVRPYNGGPCDSSGSSPLDALLSESKESPHSLKRVLGGGDLVMLAIGAVIGAGIFGSIGSAAAGQIGPNGEIIRLGAGPALIVSFVLLGACCALAGLCYAELASMIPQAGSAYAYSYATLGEFIAWIIGWDLILEYAVGNVAVAISWGDYLKSFLSGWLELPAWLTTGYRTALLSSDPAVHGLIDAAPHLGPIPILINVPAFGIVAFITWLLLRGAKESTRVNNIMVVREARRARRSSSWPA